MANKYLIIILLSALFFTRTANAEYDASKLKTLFMDVEQRHQIDRLRSGKVLHQKKAVSRQSEKVTVSGFVKRSQGKSVVWVNDSNTLNGNRLADSHVKTGRIDSNNRVTLSLDGRYLKLKPGESWVPQNRSNADTDTVMGEQN